MKKLEQVFLTINIVIVCAFVVIGGCTNTEPAVQPGGQMNAVVVTTPVPSATIVAAQTNVATSSPTTVVTTVPTTETIEQLERSPIATPTILAPPKGWTYSFQSFDKPGGVLEVTLIVENEGKTSLNKILEIEFQENGNTKHMSVSIEVPPGETRLYPICTTDNYSKRINVVGYK